MTKRSITRSIFGIAVAAMGVALVPATTYADPMTFTVNETVVPGTAPNVITDAFFVKGSYIESVTLSGNTFAANLLVQFSSYNRQDGTVTPSQVGDGLPAQEYGLYAIVTVNGTFQSGADPNDATQTLFDFDPATSTVNVFLDPDNNSATADSLILTANLIDPNVNFSDGTVTTVTATGRVVSGEFRLTYLNGTTQGLGLAYWPSFTGLTLRINATGDIDDTSVLGPTGGRITGEASVNFEGVAAPEPATLALFGMALFGSGIAARRRRKV